MYVAVAIITTVNQEEAVVGGSLPNPMRAWVSSMAPRRVASAIRPASGNPTVSRFFRGFLSHLKKKKKPAHEEQRISLLIRVSDRCMVAAQSQRPSVPVLVPDDLAVLDLEPDERRQVHRLAEHLVVLLVVDQNLKHADAYPVSRPYHKPTMVVAGVPISKLLVLAP
jgi:hypothetical protein